MLKKSLKFFAKYILVGVFLRDVIACGQET